MTINEAMTVLTESDEAFDETTVLVESLRFEPGAVTSGDSRFSFGEAGLAHLCEKAKAPAWYLNRLDAEMKCGLLEYHRAKGALGEGTVSVISRDGELVKLEKPNLLRLSGTEVLRAVLDGVGEAASEKVVVHDLNVGEGSFQLDLVSVDENEVRPGDAVRAGLRITHSSIGDHANWIETFIFRLLCRNGMTRRDCVARRGIRTRRLDADLPGAREMQVAQVRNWAQGTWNALDEKLDAIRALPTHKIEVEAVSRILQRFLERGRLSVNIFLPILLEAWEEEGAEASLFGIMNALTRVATHHEKPTTRQRQILSGLAGILSFQERHICSRCFSVLSSSPRASEPTEQLLTA